MKEYLTSESSRRYQKKWYQKHKEEFKARQREYYKEHREECLARYKKWSMTHDRSEYQREYYKRRKNGKKALNTERDNCTV